MWIARDKDGALYIFGMKPVKNDLVDAWMKCDSRGANNFAIKLPDCDLYESVWWTDDEPTELIIKQ